MGFDGIFEGFGVAFDSGRGGGGDFTRANFGLGRFSDFKIYVGDFDAVFGEGISDNV